MYLFLNALKLTPDRLMNFPVKITDRNRAGVYALGREMLSALAFLTLCTLLAVEWSTICAARSGSFSQFFLAVIFAPVVLLLASTVYYVLRMRAI